MSPDWQGILGRLRPDSVAEAARRWGAHAATLVNPGFNHVCRATDRKGALYLRFTHIELRAPTSLTPPIAYLRHAFAHAPRSTNRCPPSLASGSKPCRRATTCSSARLSAGWTVHA